MVHNIKVINSWEQNDFFGGLKTERNNGGFSSYSCGGHI